jgi:uncharacterized membrane protein
MTLPEIVLPKIEIPFDIPLLMHPPIVHFIIAIPVIVLILEILNLVMKKKAVGGVSFLLLLLTVVAAIGAYFTGLTDGKEAYAALNEAAKADLSEHKLLGTYVLLGSAVVLFFKLLAMTGSKLLKALYMIILIVFLVLLFKQGEEGGELVYEHGLNVKKVQELDNALFDLNEEKEEVKEKKIELEKPQVEVQKPIEITTPVATPKVEVVETTENTVNKSIETVTVPVVETIAPTVETVSNTVSSVEVPVTP